MENNLLVYNPVEEPTPEPLMQVTVCGTLIPIVFVANLRAEDGDACDGLFIAEVPFIAIDSSLHSARASAILFHEIGHAAMLLSGAGYLLDKKSKKNQSGELEEELMRVFIPSFLAAIETIQGAT
jgi:Zn-dependent peptidase ImmA (M78 family)